jgi:hypothetical protein
MHREEPSDARRLLAGYLRDHHAGAAAGVRLAHRIAERATDPASRDALGELAAAIDEDRRRLDVIMDALGIEPSRFKDAVGAVSERLGRLKTNGTIWRRSPASDVLELEALAAGVVAKRGLWTTLATIAVAPVPVGLEELTARADEQLASIEKLHVAAASSAFGRP